MWIPRANIFERFSVKCQSCGAKMAKVHYTPRKFCDECRRKKRNEQHKLYLRKRKVTVSVD